MKLALQLVTWNGVKYIPALFDSLKRSYKLKAISYKLLVLDNGSADGTVELLKRELENFRLPHELIELKENTGFAGGHNRLFTMNEAEYILLINQDLVFEPDSIQRLVNFLDTHPEAVAVGPRLMHFDWTIDYGPRTTDMIDSLGLKRYHSGKVADLDAGQSWSEHCQKSIVRCPWSEVFGVSGACAMFRVSALKQVAFADRTIFDESYGSYKEDVDLAWRLHSVGGKIFVLHNTVAYHARGSGQGKSDQPFPIRYQSYRNHLATLYKNFSWHDRPLDFPFILWYEGMKLIWYLVFDTKALSAWLELWSCRKELKVKRQWIQKISQI